MTLRVETLPADAPTPILDFLPPIPGSASAWDAALGAARGDVARVPPAMAERIVRRQRGLLAGPRAEANARALAEEGTLVVVTGQQPGLLGGLLLAAHKAAGTIRLAEVLDGRGRGRVVPVFWVASEDHDLDEANRLFLLDRRGQPRRLALDLEPDGRSLMHVTPPADAVAALLHETGTVLPDTDRARDALALVEGPSDTDLGTWGATAMARLLGDSGLVFLDPRDLLPESGVALARLALEADVMRPALEGASARLRAAGLVAPVDVGPDYVPLFLRPEDGGRRRRVASSSAAAVAAAVRARPELASGDVVGRVFVQDRLLPVLAYVGGPTELAYHAQVRAAHDAVGLRYPLALPRPSATWVDKKAERTAAAFGTTVEALLRMDALAAGPPTTDADADPGLDAALEAWRRLSLEVPDALTAWAAGGGERGAALERARARVEDAHRWILKQLRAVSERERGAGAARWVRLASLIRPRGRPQERGLSALSVVARYGPEAFREGLQGLDPLSPGHDVIHVG